MGQTEKREIDIEPIHIKLLTGKDVIFRPCKDEEKDNTSTH